MCRRRKQTRTHACVCVPNVVGVNTSWLQRRMGTHHKCLVGTDGCFTATSAPPLSRNHTLCSSSKICTKTCRFVAYTYAKPHLVLLCLKMGTKACRFLTYTYRNHTFSCSKICTKTCMQDLTVIYLCTVQMAKLTLCLNAHTTHVDLTNVDYSSLPVSSCCPHRMI